MTPLPYNKVMRNYTDQDITDAVASSESVAGVLRLLGLKPAGGNYKTMNAKIAALGLDTSHWTGKGWNRGDKMGLSRYRKVISLEEALVENSTYVSTSNLKKKLINAGLFEKKCYNCGLDTWLDRPIPLELEHRNGVNNDNRIENLTLLCPNCHALTDTYRGRNIGKARLM